MEDNKYGKSRFFAATAWNVLAPLTPCKAFTERGKNKRSAMEEAIIAVRADGGWEGGVY
jgi:hypothetical protein